MTRTDPLNHELEAIEAAAWRDLFEGAAPVLVRTLGLEAAQVDDATVLRAPGIDHLLFNRVLGLAPTAPADSVGRLVDGYRAAGVRRYFVHLHETADAAPLRRALEDHDLVPFHRRWVKLARGGAPPAPSRTDLTVVRARREQRFAIGELLAEGFDLPVEAIPVLASIVGRAGWHVYVALDGPRLAAAGALFARGSSANLAFAVTHPGFRRRGAQSALMARRIRVALDLGCRLITSETGEAVPGDPQHSFRNMRRHGLRPMFARENWCPAGVAWGRAVA